MPTVHRAHGLRFIIYTDDHDPAHVHAVGGGEAKIVLGVTGGSPQLVWARELSNADIRRALAEVANEQVRLLADGRVSTEVSTCDD